MKKWKTALGILVVACLLAGCSLFDKGSSNDGYAAFTPTQSGLYIKQSGIVYSADIESFEASYYSVSELESGTLKPAITAFNKETAGISGYKSGDSKSEMPVTLESLEVEDGVLTMYLRYASLETYLNFCRETDSACSSWQVAQFSPIADLSANGMSFSGTFVDVSTGETVEQSVLEALTEAYVIAVDFGTNITVEGDLLYVTSGVVVQDSHTVTTTDSGTQFIIFKAS